MPTYQMAGRFWDKMAVKLGHLRTDDAGRLLVFPADGVANSALPQNPVRDFTNNDGWHDDWCDGWVKATVRVGDTDVDCEPAWVVCCGPKFAPQIEPIVSLYDAAREAMMSRRAYENAARAGVIPPGCAADSPAVRDDAVGRAGILSGQSLE